MSLRFLALLVLLPVSCSASVWGLWGGRSPVRLAEFLDRPFDQTNVCLFDLYDGALKARDMLLLGSPRQVVETFVIYDDNGAGSERRTITRFLRNGDIQGFVVSDKDGVSEKADFRYDVSHRLIAVKSIARNRCDAKLTYDPSGKLVRIDTVSSDKGSRTVLISRERDGRPREAIARRATGQADWRLAYSYAGKTTTIDRYVRDDAGRETRQTTRFELDGGGRIVHAKAERDDPYPESNIFRFTYRPDGTASVHLDLAVNHQPCTYDFVVHRNGMIDQGSIRARGTWALCTDPVQPGEQVQEFFDSRGNRVVNRYGKEAMELGRRILRPTQRTLNAITYY